MTPRHFIATLTASLALQFACSAPQGTKPDDMSAEEHRAHAAAARNEAHQHDKRYDPKASATELAPGAAASSAAGFDFPLVTYNPTSEHLAHAKEHRSVAAAHEKAARELERFEDDTCKRFPPKTRSMCPVMGPITGYEEIEDGIRLYLREGIPLPALAAHIECHFAYGRTRGFGAMPDCPLYLRGLKFTSDAKKRFIELKVSDPKALAELRRRAATHATKR